MKWRKLIYYKLHLIILYNKINNLEDMYIYFNSEGVEHGKGIRCWYHWDIKNRESDKQKGFIDRIFTTDEIIYFKEKSFNKFTIAGAFAAKEAISKVLGTGIRGFNWTDIEIKRDELGCPMVTLFNNAQGIATEKGITNIEISISHCREYAIANAIGY